METSNWFQFRWLAIGLMAIFMSVAFQVPANGDIFEGFEAGVMPPAHWSIQRFEYGSWQIDDISIYSGSYAAKGYGGGLIPVDNWLVSPYLTNPTFVGFYSASVSDWCLEAWEMCDLEVWLIKGAGINDGDDIYLGRADDDWVYGEGFQYSSFYPSSDPGTRSRIAFRHEGYNIGIYTSSISVWLDSITIQENEELRVDFGGSGLWTFDIAGNWHKFSPQNAQWLERYGDKLVGDFGALGLYEYNGFAWTRIAFANADNSGNTMVAFNGGLAVDVGAGGLWYYDAGGSWSQISTANAQWLGVYGINNDKLAADFGTLGMYEYDGATWVKITTGNADNSGNTMVAFNNDLVVDFGASGLYSYNGSTWTRLSTGNAQWLEIGGGGLYADFGASGFYFHDGTWTKISTGDADNSGNTMVGVGAGVVVDFGASGLYLYQYSGDNWIQLSPSNTQWLIYNGSNYVYADFGTFGFYRTNGSTWTKISTGDADNSGNTMLFW